MALVVLFLAADRDDPGPTGGPGTGLRQVGVGAQHDIRHPGRRRAPPGRVAPLESLPGGVEHRVGSAHGPPGVRGRDRGPQPAARPEHPAVEYLPRIPDDLDRVAAPQQQARRRSDRTDHPRQPQDDHLGVPDRTDDRRDQPDDARRQLPHAHVVRERDEPRGPPAAGRCRSRAGCRTAPRCAGRPGAGTGTSSCRRPRPTRRARRGRSAPHRTRCNPGICRVAGIGRGTARPPRSRRRRRGPRDLARSGGSRAPAPADRERPARRRATSPRATTPARPGSDRLRTGSGVADDAGHPHRTRLQRGTAVLRQRRRHAEIGRRARGYSRRGSPVRPAAGSSPPAAARGVPRSCRDRWSTRARRPAPAAAAVRVRWRRPG